MSRYAAIHRLRRARGIAMVTAIFLLVVLAGLGVAIISVMTTEQASQSLDLLGGRAYQSARAGMDWAVYQFTHQASPVAPPAVPAFCGKSFAMPAGTSLSGFTVTVTCTADANPLTAPPAGGAAPTRIRVLSVACNQPSSGACPNASPASDYAERQVEAEI